MRGKDGYKDVLKVISALKNQVPVFVMFTLSPYNDFEDLEHVAELCKKHGVFLRVGIYNNIPFFDTIDDAKKMVFGAAKNQELLKFSDAKKLQQEKPSRISEPSKPPQLTASGNYRADIPPQIKEFKENYDYVSLYQNWLSGNLRLKCNSILDSLIVLPDGNVPICQNLDLKLGNIHQKSLDEIFNSPESAKTQAHYSNNCNQCWISYHRKYDIVLYRTFERYFGKSATSKLLGYYKWDSDDKLSYNQAVR
jgi:MoaA/NifB/PqqE/SkfB family radical SAM enzyme